ncbi:hypothetical protein [Alistipes sp.]|jgi:hypothetical protein|uniref:hypothetical protein n=1 Tax=Alistipes sp. TaxID=1872444 RepID=UPI003AF04093
MEPFFGNLSRYDFLGFPVAGPFVPLRPFPVRRRNVRTLDQRGIYELCTTGLVENLETESTADYGVSRRAWNALPCECVVVWKVRQPVSQNGAGLPVTIVVPVGASDSTIAGTTNGAKMAVIDNKGTQVQGHDVTVPTGSGSSGDQQQVGYTTEHWVYINKSAGIFRLMGVTAQNSPARAASTPAGNTEAQAVKLK